MVFHTLGVYRGGFLIDSQGNEKPEYRFVAFSGCCREAFSLSCQLDRPVRCCIDEAFCLQSGNRPCDSHVADAEVDCQVTNTART